MGKEPNSNAVNLICEGTSIVGDIKTKNDIRIDGSIKGKVHTTGRLVVGNTAKIEGDIECTNIDVMGVVMGNINAEAAVTLKAPARIVGNIVSAVLSVEQGVFFDGKCQMVKKEVHESKEIQK